LVGRHPIGVDLLRTAKARIRRTGPARRDRAAREPPPHRTYEITKAGREEFRDLLRQAWLGITRYSRPIDLAASFYDDLDRAEIIDLLKQRLDNLAQLERAFHPELTPPLSNPAQRAVVDDLRDLT
jgi:DNA-binding PadR family transcriptional regulator